MGVHRESGRYEGEGNDYSTAKYAGADPSASPSSSSKTDDELKGEALRQRASDLDIDGRSEMNADELRKAVPKAESEG